MEATSVLSSSSTSSFPPSHILLSSYTSKPQMGFIFNSLSKCTSAPRLLFSSSHQTSVYTNSNSSRFSVLRPSALTVEEAVEQSTDTFSVQPKIDKSGRFCSPRAARELALMTIYGACLEGSGPVRLFEKRMNIRREPGYEFDKEWLVKYNHMSFGGPPVKTETVEEADELLKNDENDSEIEAEVLSAPPKLVYSKLILRFSRKLLVAVEEKWDNNVLAINKVAPDNWKNEPASRILEFSILHLSMAEISVLGTRHQIVINEAVDLAKRFCDGAAPRIINGCLRTFVKDLERANSRANQSLFT
ncbi:PREDICTED: uncharacterized protein LOC109230127 isoform X2 [Nicotiana attenuata]|uniref:NusB/RsmB/TIM44 domain-containing protein n=1 Tax=Nicotiana attenuata TaxID=49451 RepID=A0A1J6ITH7_NICAT|nr:PREDICTED: uncharacterized protein LOC109230127 isoform X2 [Nicotiana attenuata]OIT08509.1 hypothetical protein A4A49_00952 [Nicotiana attenuata]